MTDRASLIQRAMTRADALIAMTRDMVRIDTQTPPSDTRSIARMISGWLADIPGVVVSTHVSEPPIENIVARLDGGLPGKRLVLNGHLDTYPIGDESDWTQDPLGGALVAGRLYGRGSADMKGGVAALMECLRLFALHMRPFPGEIVLVLGGDEERMGELGVQWLIDHVTDVHGDAVIVADVGGPSAVRLGEKGMLWLELEATGKQAHGAHVHAGENAADRLIDALRDMRQLEAMVPAARAGAQTIIDAAAAIKGADGPKARETMQRVSVNLGTLRGGTSPNLVPSRAMAGLDIRIPLGLTARDVLTAVESLLEPHRAVSWKVERVYDPTWTDATSRVAEACLTASEQVLGIPAWPDMRIGGSDARLWRRAGFETVVLGLTPHNLGAPDEYLRADELGPMTAIYCCATFEFLLGEVTTEGGERKRNRDG